MNNSHQILIEAKNEYTKQLTKLLYKPIYDGIDSIYKFSLEEGSSQILKKFQEHLGNIPKWSKSMIKNEYNRICDKIECDWLEELITAVFVSHTKVLTIIKVSEKNNKSIDLKVPCGQHFLHKCYIECARQFWKRPYLFDHRINNIEKQRNINESEDLISKSIEETIRNMLPVRTILKEYLGPDFEDDIEEEDLSQNISKTHTDNIRKMVKKEIELSLNNLEDKNENDINDNYSNYKLDTTSIVSNNLENSSYRLKKNKDLDNKSIELEDIDSKILDNIEFEETMTKNFDETEQENIRSNDDFRLEENKNKQSDDIKKENNESNISDEIKVEEINNNKSDEIKLEENKSNKSDEIKLEEIKSNKSDEIKLEEIKSNKLDENKLEEIKSNKPDEIKLEETKIIELKETKKNKLEESKKLNKIELEESNQIESEGSKKADKIELENSESKNGIGISNKDINNKDLSSEGMNFNNSILELEKELNEISSNSELTTSTKVVNNDNLFDDAIYFNP